MINQHIAGQFEDFIEQMKIIGLPPHANYLFLGDYVDRFVHLFKLILFCNQKVITNV